ncbi:Major Facilitator Superfamily protein [Planctomycetes bacterium Poly30]|uniref:Major Facilitator Superfamily protein n=1 Tax=Saltatorellus ferox TaxID=2528018 RepID=A0A518ETK9_9BACT|nr:Major Facilitator Superfamily protein [Planctomycetes bacterium Poly30]
MSFSLIQRGEGKPLLLAMAFFFALLGSYYLLRPVRDAYGSSDPDRLRWLFVGTFALTLIVQPAFGALVSRFGRLRIVPVSYRALSLITIVLGLLLGRFEGATEQFVRDVFFCWLSVFSIVGVSIFWGLLADLYGRERALRLFGFVAVGGTLGAISGASIASFASSLLPKVGLGPEHLPFLSAACLEICVWIQRSLQRASATLEPLDPAKPEGVETASSDAPIGGSVLAGFRRVAQSPYLMLACVYVAIYVVGSTLAYDVGARLAKAAFEADDDARRAFFGKIDLATNVVTLFLQLFASGYVLRKLGVGIGLAAVPLVGVAGFAALAVDPSLTVLAVFAVGRRGAEYGVSKPARDALFTVVPQEDKYKAKLVVDTVIYRGGDVASVWLKYALIAGGVSASAIAWGLVGLAGAGVAVSLALGRGFKARAAEAPVRASGQTPGP